MYVTTVADLTEYGRLVLHVQKKNPRKFRDPMIRCDRWWWWWWWWWCISVDDALGLCSADTYDGASFAMKFSRRIAYCAMCANNGRITPDAAYVTRLGPSHVAHTASGAIPQLLFRGSDLIDIPSNDDGEDRNNKSYISSTTHMVYTWWARRHSYKFYIPNHG